MVGVHKDGWEQTEWLMHGEIGGDSGYRIGYRFELYFSQKHS